MSYQRARQLVKIVHSIMGHRRLYLILAAVIFITTFTFIGILRRGSWGGSRRITIAVNSEPMIIFSIEPVTKRAILLTFPANTLLEVPYGYGSYPASSVFRLGELDKRYGGGKLLCKSVEGTFGLAVEGYFAAKQNPFLLSIPDHSKFPDLKRSYFSLSGAIFSSPKWVGALKKMDTNFSLIDLLYLWNALRTIRTDRIAIVPLEENKILREEVQPDGSRTKVIDEDLLDFIISDNFQDQLIRSEDISIEVVNASGKEKAAFEFSKILTHMGAKVISRSTAKEKKAHSCLIFVSQKSFVESQVISRIKKIYGCKVSLETDRSSQADVEIVLGEEFIQRHKASDIDAGSIE